MATPVTLLVGYGATDAGFSAAVEDLRALSRHHLLWPFWVVDASTEMFSDAVAADLVADGDSVRTGLFRSLAEVPDVGVTRIVIVASADLEQDAISGLAVFARALRDRLRWLQPEGLPVRSAAIAFPESLIETSPLVDLFDPTFDANLVVSPEDRKADGAFAAPVALRDLAEFAAHMAAELATQAGLWRAMGDAPIDFGSAGVIDGSDPMVHIVRSYACSAIGPALPLFEAFPSGGAVPVPVRLQPSPNPGMTARALGEQLLEESPTLRYGAPEPFTVDRSPSRLREAVPWWLGRTGEYLKSIPRSLRDSLSTDLDATGGRTFTLVLGEYAEKEVIWAGKGEGADFQDPVEEVEQVEFDLENRLGALSAPSIEQSVWTRIVRDVLGSIDANPAAETFPTVAGQRLIITEPSVVAPAPAPDFAEAVDSFSQSRGLSDPALTSDLFTRVEGEQRRAESALRGQVEDMRRLARLARVGNVSDRPVLTWGIGVLIAFIVVVALLWGDVPHLVGIDRLSGTFRYIVGIAISVAALAAAWVPMIGAFVADGLNPDDQSTDETFEPETGSGSSGTAVKAPDESERPHSEEDGTEPRHGTSESPTGSDGAHELSDDTPGVANPDAPEAGTPTPSQGDSVKRPSAWRRFLAWRRKRKVHRDATSFAQQRKWALILVSTPVVIGVVLALYFHSRRFGAVVWAQFPPEELALIFATLSSITVALQQVCRVPRHRSAGARRLIGIDLILYAAVAVVGLVARDRGWIDSLSKEALGRFSKWALPIAGIVVLVLFVVLVVVRVQERIAMANALKRLRWNEAAAKRAVDEIVRLRAVIRQFLGTAVALNRMVWLPFGKAPAHSNLDITDIERLEALKLRLMTFSPSDRGRRGALARIRNVIAQPGWLLAQYGVATDAFIPELAFLTGRDMADVWDLRPETDPTIDDPRAPLAAAGAGPRWRFAELLYGGEFDDELAASAFKRLFADALDPYLESGATHSDEGVLDLGRSLLAGQAPRIQADVLERIGLLTADDDRAWFRATIWWPEPLADPPGVAPTSTVRQARVDHADTGRLVIQLARSDWSQPFPLRRLPLCGIVQGDSTPRRGEPSPGRPGL